jgi:hypothetical protein
LRIRIVRITLAAMVAVALAAAIGLGVGPATAGEGGKAGTAMAPASPMAGEHMDEPMGEHTGEHHEEGERLPEAFHFLNAGWWVVHIIAIPVLWIIGYAMGKKAAAA